MKKISIALFQPDIPQNTGTILRLADCLDVHVDIIKPCGFVFGGSHMRRSSMDYLDSCDYTLHDNYEDFLQVITKRQSRLVISTTKTTMSYYDFSFKLGDTILFGSESSGLPQYIHDSIKDKITIPMAEGKRSLNIAVSCGIMVSEALKNL